MLPHAVYLTSVGGNPACIRIVPSQIYLLYTCEGNDPRKEKSQVICNRLCGGIHIYGIKVDTVNRKITNFDETWVQMGQSYNKV